MKDFTYPTSLLNYEILRRRQKLPTSHVIQYDKLYKGMVGEATFQQFIPTITPENIIPLTNILLDTNDTVCQIDSLLLTNDTIYLLEIKNYTGDYYMNKGKFYSLQSHKEIRNPFSQLERTTFLFQNWLEQNQFHLKVKSYIVFINPTFVLYETPIQTPIIFHGQVKRFIQKIIQNSYPLKREIRHVAKSLQAINKDSTSYERMPSYNWDDLSRGMFCWYCIQKLVRANQYNFHCSNCQLTFDIESTLIHAIEELCLLKRTHKLTITTIYEWIGQLISSRTVRIILRNRKMYVPNGRFSYFEHPDYPAIKSNLGKRFFTQIKNP